MNVCASKLHIPLKHKYKNQEKHLPKYQKSIKGKLEAIFLCQNSNYHFFSNDMASQSHHFSYFSLINTKYYINGIRKHDFVCMQTSFEFYLTKCCFHSSKCFFHSRLQYSNRKFKASIQKYIK